MVSYDIKVKNEFFITALFIEDMITAYMSNKLEIDDCVNSQILGNNNTSLTFDQKIEWVLETNKLSVIDNSKLSVFREIRKELLLNKDAPTLEEALNSKDNNADFLLILYPQSNYLPREEKLNNACYQLIGEISEIIASFTQEKEIKVARQSIGEKIYQSIASSQLNKLSFLFTFLLLK